MIVLTLEALTGLFALILGLLALLIGRDYPSRGVRRASWLLTGGSFTLFGLIRCAQQAAATRAFLAGRGSEAWDAYLTWAPAMNHARGFLILAFVLLLGMLGWLSRVPGRRWGVAAGIALAAATLVGGWMGWVEGPFVARRHFAALATSDAMLAVVIGVVLVTHLARDTMDRLLWCCLCVYGFHVITAGMLMSVFAWIGVEGVWYPSMATAAAADVASAVAMTAIVTYALVLTRRGVYIPALLEHPQPLKTAALP